MGKEHGDCSMSYYVTFLSTKHNYQYKLCINLKYSDLFHLKQPNTGVYTLYYIFLCSILYFQIKVTTCGGVKLELISTWKDGKVWEYKSTNSADPPQV